MLSRISQLKQTISEELEGSPKQHNDPIGVIERNKAVLSENTNVDEVVKELNSETAESTPKESNQNETDPKLVKLAKFEEKYPLLLKAYKAEKKKMELVKQYELVLSEHTPCTSIAQPQELVDYLQNLVGRNEMLLKELESIKQKHELLNQKTESQQNEIQQQKTIIQKLNLELKQEQQKNEVAKIDSELKAKLDLAEEQLQKAEQSRDAAQKSQQALRTQYDEINVRLKEVLNESDVIRDELLEAERVSNQRLTELSALKNKLLNKERSQQQNNNSVNDQVEQLQTENSSLENEVQQLNKRIIREREQLQAQIKSLRVQLKDSEEHENELRKQIKMHSKLTQDQQQQQQQPQSTTIVETAHDSIPLKKFEESQAAASSATKANLILKQVNEDNVLRIQKLQKTQRALSSDLELLRHENEVLKQRQRPQPVGTSSAEQQVYLKNVLMGFVEHKEQRKTLLPVISTLLNLNDEERGKFMSI